MTCHDIALLLKKGVDDFSGTILSPLLSTEEEMGRK
jgi:hypothetical protein